MGYLKIFKRWAGQTCNIYLVDFDKTENLQQYYYTLFENMSNGTKSRVNIIIGGASCVHLQK